jgi:hypothetical protein
MEHGNTRRWLHAASRRRTDQGRRVSALPLFEPSPPAPKLGARQQLVHQALLDGGWLTDSDAGLLIHLARGCRFCRPGEPCRYAAGEGRAVLASLRPKVGLVRRKSGRWEFKDSGRVSRTVRPARSAGAGARSDAGQERNSSSGQPQPVPNDRAQDRRGIEAPFPPTASALTEQAEEAVGASDARPGDDPEDGMSLGEWMQLGCP